jgi:hypothetical protein
MNTFYPLQSLEARRGGAPATQAEQSGGHDLLPRPNRARSERPSRPKPTQLSHELRRESSPDLTRRRWLVGLNLAAATLGKIVSLYQVGIIRRLPDLPFRPFDAERVDASPYAYKRMQMPDGFLMTASYLMTAALAGAGGKHRDQTDPMVPVALAGKTFIDAATGLWFTREGWKEQRALCGYCQASTLISLVSFGLAVPEAVKVLQARRA